MKSLPEFKEQMTSLKVPNYVIRYCEDLDKQKWKWFYVQMKNALEVTNDVDYLFYVLKWILKYDFDDLTYAIFLQDYMDPEMRPESLIKDEWHGTLYERYKDRLAEDVVSPDEGVCFI